MCKEVWCGQSYRQDGSVKVHEKEQGQGEDKKWRRR